MIVFFYNDVPHLIAERAADTVAWCSATLRRNQPQPNRWILHLATLGEFDRSQTAGYSPLGHPVQNLTTAKWILGSATQNQLNVCHRRKRAAVQHPQCGTGTIAGTEIEVATGTCAADYYGASSCCPTCTQVIDDPTIFMKMDDVRVHAAVGLNGSPVLQQATAAQSFQTFTTAGGAVSATPTMLW